MNVWGELRAASKKGCIVQESGSKGGSSNAQA